jgi:hypothetical protein
MSESRLTFQKFNDIGLANSVAEKLEQAGISCIIENNQGLFNPSFSSNTIQSDISLTIKPEDFDKAHQALANLYAQQLNDVEEDYYLFAFSDEELLEIVAKPDEWGHFDYQLAQKILREKGKSVEPEKLAEIRSRRNQALKKSGSISTIWIFLGYGLILIGIIGIFMRIADDGFYMGATPFISLVIGASLAFGRQTLPTGETMYNYEIGDRNHGKIIFVAALFFCLLWLYSLYIRMG